MSDIIITNESGALNQKNNIAMKFSFQGSTLELCLLILKNVILTIVSLGVYFPWAKTAMRNYLWSNTN